MKAILIFMLGFYLFFKGTDSRNTRRHPRISLTARILGAIMMEVVLFAFALLLWEPFEFVGGWLGAILLEALVLGALTGLVAFVVIETCHIVHRAQRNKRKYEAQMAAMKEREEAEKLAQYRRDNFVVVIGGKAK